MATSSGIPGTNIGTATDRAPAISPGYPAVSSSDRTEARCGAMAAGLSPTASGVGRRATGSSPADLLSGSSSWRITRRGGTMATGDKYRAVHAHSLKDPEGFWAKQAEAIDWTKRWEKVLDPSQAPFYRWYPGGELNACYNALDR